MQVLSFVDALAEAREYAANPHLLLGNGFSIACRPDRFRYDALLEHGDFSGAHGDVRALFDTLGTADFERVIEMLQVAAAIAEHYGAANDLEAHLLHDAEIVRSALAVALASRHPDVPFEISESEYVATRTFLSPFDKIYTLNYDMLLYWTIMQTLEPSVSINDGFTASDDDEAEYVVWEPYLDFGSQRIFFLHGGLHLYDSGKEISKITWSRTGIPLVDQIRSALAVGRYPLIVTEGRSEEKEEKILHNAYLTHALRSFARISKVLFIHGHSLAPNDQHVLRRIESGRLDRLYISIHDDPGSPTNRTLIQAAEAMAEKRAATNPRRPLHLRFYSAQSAGVWQPLP